MSVSFAHALNDKVTNPEYQRIRHWRFDNRNDFFFQAEDGIRDHCVTGVHTCALPISIFAFSLSEAFTLLFWNIGLVDLILQKSKVNASDKEKANIEREADGSEGSDDGFEKIKRSEAKEENDEYAETEDYDILNLDLPDWDYCFTPLHHAIFSGHLTVVQRLVEEGADVTIPVKIPRAPNDAPYSVKNQTLFPIVLCANTEHGLSIAQFLVRSGVSSQSDSTSTTALHMLVSAKHLDLVKLL